MILLDAMMPDMDGFEVAARIRRDPNLNRGAIIMLTSADGQGDASRCRELGIAGYLVKPVKPQDLNRAIGTALQNSPIHHAAKAVEPVTAAERPLRILLAEDNAVNRLVVVKLLEKQGHTLTVAHHGGEAVNAMDAGTFDLVLMDVQMPEMDGFEATAVIRAKEAKSGTYRTPIVAMTAHAMKGDRERCLANDMDDYVSKPIQRAELNRVLRWAAELSREALPKRSDPEPTICNRIEALQRLGGDSDLFAELAALFITDAPVQLASAVTALRNGDGPGLKRVGHTLVGAAGYLGGTPVVTAARRLEAVGDAEDWNAAPEAYDKLAVEIHRLTVDLTSVPAVNLT